MLGRRDDGFHELESLFVEVDVADELEVEFGGGEDEIELRGRPVDGDPRDNLCLRAVRGWRALTPGLPPVRIRLDKRVPIGSGMGGGSSDAAFVLAALEALSEPSPSPEAIARLAASLGSDVPFFLRGGNAICRGRGERIEPVEGLPKMWFAVAKPDASLGTAGVYSRLRLKDKGRDVQSFLMTLKGDSGGDPECFNRLEGAAFDLAPALRDLRDQLVRQSDAAWTLTGSGSAFFSLCPTADHAAERCSRLSGLELADVFVTASEARASMNEARKPSS